MLGIELLWYVVAQAMNLLEPAETPARTPAPIFTLAPLVTAPAVVTPAPTSLAPATPPPRVFGNVTLPPYVAVSPTPTTKSCPPGRQAKPGETVYMTVDDGPSIVGRQNLLEALDQIHAKASFFESGYNLCGSETRFAQTQQCQSGARSKITELSVWTIKLGHMLAAHSDTHFYDAVTTKCDYGKMAAAIKVEDGLARCGHDPIADFVRGAIHFEDVWRNATLWDTTEELALYERQHRNLWTFARLPCTDIWRMPHYKAASFGSESAAEKSLRTDIAEQLASGAKLTCKNETFSGLPWTVMGWDVEWRWDSSQLKDLAAEKCRIVQAIEKNFDAPTKDAARRKGVVLLAHDFHYSTKELAAMFRDTIVELRLRGYAIDTVDNYKLEV
ncbi:hypothetical protein ACHHYP_11936 [Achlya hypogyna]|uniref:NodB homology domain-containing protein n=1 Tax=Achlya hypogyna TaxID=1202772 RepID=A0A1V9YI03_ACHHY|nr:hypothetical protein ACHHYP_11936 [Achlya hypogyna]